MKPKYIIILILVVICFGTKTTLAQQLPCNTPRFLELYNLGKSQYATKDYANAIINLGKAGGICPLCKECQTLIAASKKAIAAATAQAKEKQRLAELAANKAEQVARATASQIEKDRQAADKAEKDRLIAENQALKLKLAEAKKPKPENTAQEATPTNGQVKEIAHGIKLVYVQGDVFMMGNNENDADERPVHGVRVSSFYMGKYEVTQAQWQAVMGSNPSYFKNCTNCPVEQVSWNDVQEFIKKLNAQTGENYRLPTEAEWEYAAGGGSSNRTRFGNGQDILDPAEANFDASAAYKTAYSVAGQYRAKTTAVGSFRANALGLYDMTGNVWEWCTDWYASDWYAQAAAMQPNPQNTNYGPKSYRVVRGGSWYDSPQNSRVAYRRDSSPTHRGYDVGFRLVSPQ